MKATFIILLFVLLSNTLLAQYKNLDKLPQKERDSLLVKIANEAIDRFSIGYLRPNNKPYIEDIGYKLSEIYRLQSMPEYADRYLYAVYYLATEKEKEVYKNDTLVKAFVLADIGQVTKILYIDSYDWCQIALEKVGPQDEVVKRKFKTAEERLKEIERAIPKTVRIEPTPEMFPQYFKYIEKHKNRQDSLRILRQRYLQKRDSIRRQDSISRQEVIGKQDTTKKS